jgi:hypothetical protein
MNLKWKGLSIFLALGLILVGAISYQIFTVRNAMAAADSPVGSWTVTVSPDGGTPFVDGVIFHSDGTLIAMEDTGVIGLGVWEKLSGNQYAFTIWEFFEQDGSFLHAKVWSTFELNNDKEGYTGPYNFQLTDLAGNVIVEGGGTATGVRNHVEPMP